MSVLDGPNNDSDYAYLGCVYTPSQVYRHGRKSRIAFDAPSAVAFDWVWAQLREVRCTPSSLSITKGAAADAVDVSAHQRAFQSA